MNDKKITVVVAAKNRTRKVLKKVSEEFKKFSKIVGVASLTIGSVAIKKAMTFEKKMGDISTLISGDSTRAVKELGDSIKEMSKEIPQSIDDLGGATYDILSAGIKGAATQMKVLKESAKLATAGLGDTKGATDLMTSSINAFNIPAEDAGKISDILFKTVKNGKTTVDQLKMAFGATAPIVAEAGFLLEDFSAATAALTTTGLPASQAQNSLRQAIVSLNKPTKEMRELFEKIGVKGLPEMIEKGMTMGDVFLELSDAAERDADMLGRAFGSVEAYNAAIGVGIGVSDKYLTTLEDMKTGTNAINEAFEKQKKTADALYKQLKNKLDVAIINMGASISKWLLPQLENVDESFDVLERGVTRLDGSFMNSEMFNEPGTKKLTFFGRMLQNITDNPINCLIIGIGLIASGLGIMVEKGKKHLKDFVDGWNESWRGMRATFEYILKDFEDGWNEGWRRMRATFEYMWLDMKRIGANTLNAVLGFVEKIAKALNRALGLKKKVESIRIDTSQTIERMERIKQLGGSDVAGPLLPRRAVGGPVSSGNPYIVGERGPEIFHPSSSGEIISNNKISNFGGNTFNFNISVSKEVDSDVFMEKLKRTLELNNLSSI